MSAIDVTPLLEPITGESPVGLDLRESDDPNNDYRSIRDDRKRARDFEDLADLGESTPDGGEPRSEAMQLWRQVEESGRDYVANQSKDIEIAAYLVEAMIRRHGVVGLRDGARVLLGLVEQYWGELYPRPDLDYDEGIEATLTPIGRLDFNYALQRIPVTEDTSIGEFVVWQHTQATQLESFDAEERQRRVEQGAITTEMFDRAAAETTPEFFQQLKTEIDEAVAAVNELGSALDERAGMDAPNLKPALEALEEADRALRLIAGTKLASDEPMEDGVDSGGEDSGEGATGGGGGGGQSVGAIRGREDAFKELEKIALWFERAEPQSILPTEIRKAIRRGRMSPAELYADLIDDESVRDRLYRDVGIESSSGNDDDY